MSVGRQYERGQVTEPFLMPEFISQKGLRDSLVSRCLWANGFLHERTFDPRSPTGLTNALAWVTIQHIGGVISRVDFDEHAIL